MKYVVIIFSLDNLEYVSAAPIKWLNEEQSSCKWPKHKAIERKAINLSMLPEDDWFILEDIRIVGCYATLKEALAMEKLKQHSTDSESDKCGKRKIKKNRKYRDDSISPPPGIEDEEFYISKTPSVSSDTSATSTHCENSSKIHQIMTTGQKNDLYDIREEIITAKENQNLTKDENNTNDNGMGQLLTVDDIENADVLFEDTLMVDTTNTRSSQHLESNDNTISSELKELKRLIIYIMRRIEGIELHLNKMSSIQNDHKRSLLQTVNLPLTELVQLQSLEDKLSNNEFRNELFDMLRFSGGSKERDCVNRCLEKIFTNYLAQFCSWTGKKNNFKLSSLTLMTTIKLAVRETFGSLTDENFERHVMNWFQHSATRLKRENV